MIIGGLCDELLPRRCFLARREGHLELQTPRHTKCRTQPTFISAELQAKMLLRINHPGNMLVPEADFTHNPFVVNHASTFMSEGLLAHRGVSFNYIRFQTLTNGGDQENAQVHINRAKQIHKQAKTDQIKVAEWSHFQHGHWEPNCGKTDTQSFLRTPTKFKAMATCFRLSDTNCGIGRQPSF